MNNNKRNKPDHDSSKGNEKRHQSKQQRNEEPQRGCKNHAGELGEGKAEPGRKDHENRRKDRKTRKGQDTQQLVATGMRMDTEDEELLRNTMEKIINKELSLNVKVKKVYKIGQDKYNVEMNKWNEKLMVLKTKGKLRGKEIYTDSALTLTKREIQKNIRDFAKKERINGTTVRVKYQGVEIDGRSWKWNKKEQKLMKVGEIKAPKN
jgi:thiol:disulfide interchange protein